MGPKIYAIRVQFLINSAVLDKANIYCWHLDIYGCLTGEYIAGTLVYCNVKRCCHFLAEPEPSSSIYNNFTSIRPSPSNTVNNVTLFVHLPKIIVIPIGAGIVLLILTITTGVVCIKIRKR